jgi:phosphoglycerate dehydrogenase-like enzyme
MPSAAARAGLLQGGSGPPPRRGKLRGFLAALFSKVSRQVSWKKGMSALGAVQVLCLRPESDFLGVGVRPPGDLAVAYRAPDAPDVPALLAEAEALVLASAGPPLSAALLAGARRLRIIQFTGAGVDRASAVAEAGLSVPVCNVPGGNAREVAEYVVITAGLLLRRLLWADRQVRAGRFDAGRDDAVRNSPLGYSGLQVGIVGFGRVGIAVASAMTALGARAAYFDPVPPQGDVAARLGAEAMPLQDLLRWADVVTVHVPLLESTRSLLGERELSLIKPSAILIQPSRGGVVDEEALARRLEAGLLAGAAVDVYRREPPDVSSPLFRLSGDAASRLLVTPHIAGVTRQSYARLFEASWENVRRVLVDGRPPENCVRMAPA